MIKRWILSNKLYLIGALAGAVIGFVYWKMIGCQSGTCLITANPYRSTLYFAGMGAVFLGIFKKGD